MKKENELPWAFMDQFRGKEFTGEWPNIRQMFHMSVLRFPNNLCFHAFSPKEIKFT